MSKPISVASLSIVSAAPATVFAQDQATAIVDALNGIVKQQPGIRSSNAKGQCVKGTFAPTAEARALTQSATFAKQVPVLGRFSMGTGNVKIHDATKGAIRGFGFKLDPNSKTSSEFAFISTPMFLAWTPEQLRGFLAVRAPGADGKPDMEKIKAFGDANPETRKQCAWLAGKPVPGSFAGLNYWGIHAYSATNSGSAAQTIKLKLVPTGGDIVLTDDEAKAKPADFLVADLSDRLAKGPTVFNLVAVMGQAGDVTNDATSLWTDEETRKTTPLGALAVTGLEDNKVCDAVVFDPTVLSDGLAGAKDDPLFAIRAGAYAMSLTCRSN